MTSALLAARAYAAAQGAPSPAAPRVAEQGPDFAQILQQSMGDAVSASRNAETQMAAHTQGRAQLVDVVTAVASAQSSLETVMAVRDQVISAYQEIMRMPI